MQWRLLAEALERGLGPWVRGVGGTGSVEALVDLGSVLFLYSGSCASATYLTVLRPAMSRHHPAFSGEWAADYHRIPGLIRQAPGTAGAPSVSRVRAAWRLNRHVHAAVANKLVPGQPSLLRRAGRRPGAEPSAVEADLFDAFFRTRRAMLCRRGFYVQLLHRLDKMIADLERMALYYDSPPVSAGVSLAHCDRIAYLESAAVPLLADQAAAVGECLERTVE